MNLTKPQSVQESEYAIPYHYLTSRASLLGLPAKIHTAPIYLTYLDRIIERLGSLGPDERVLDAGCGDGRLIFELRHKYPDARIAGVDYSRRAVSFARIFNPGTELEVADLTKPLDFEAESFDACVSMETLEHIPPDQVGDALENIYRVLRPGGRFVMTVPHRNRPLDEKHFQHFDSRSLEHILSQRFEVVEIEGFHDKSSWKNTVLQFYALAYYFAYPLKKLGLTRALETFSNAGFSFFDRKLANCGTDAGLSLIAVCRN